VGDVFLVVSRSHGWRGGWVRGGGGRGMLWGFWGSNCGLGGDLDVGWINYIVTFVGGCGWVCGCLGMGWKSWVCGLRIFGWFRDWVGCSMVVLVVCVFGGGGCLAGLSEGFGGCRFNFGG